MPFCTGPSCPRFSRQRFKSEDAPKIHVSLSISLFLLNLAFFINVGQRLKGSDAACWARGAIFHYFLLCAFTWMSLEAFHLYLLVIKVFNTYFSHYFLKLSLVGWGRCLLARQRFGWLCLDEARRGPALGRAMGRGSSHSDWLRARRMDGGMGMWKRTCQGSLSDAIRPSLLAPSPACPNSHRYWDRQQLRPLLHP